MYNQSCYLVGFFFADLVYKAYDVILIALRLFKSIIEYELGQNNINLQGTLPSLPYNEDMIKIFMIHMHY